MAWVLPPTFAEEFDVESDDFSKLEPREANNSLWYFYDTARRSLVKHFRLYDGPQVATLITVTLIKKGGKFQPRIRLWKRKTNSSKVATESVPAESSKDVKALVDTDNCHENFWRVIEFVYSLHNVDVPRQPFRLVDASVSELADLLKGQDRQFLISAVRDAVGGDLTRADIDLLLGRKAQLGIFKQLLENRDGAFDQLAARLGSREKVWQKFFERNQWIFGYGLSLISCQALDDTALERITTGASVFAGAGKRIDAILRTRGYVRSLVFAEIKTHETGLLNLSAYRPPDVLKASAELVGAVAQVQKTTEKAMDALHGQIHRLFTSEGEYTGIEFSTTRPRQIVIAGTLKQLETGDALNPERVQTFELYRRSLLDVEIITFDELYERAIYIVADRDV